MKIITTPLCVGLFAASGILSANEQQTIDEEILVTGARTTQLLSESLSSATVITAGDIEAAQASSMIDVLNQVVGADVDQSGSRGSLANLRLRGSESDQVLVLVDGVRIAGASSGLAAIQHIPVEHIDRIEIVRGPRSSLYGADAIAGVIQVFTKNGRGEDQKLAGNVQLGVRSHDTYEGQAGIRGRSGGTYYSANLSIEDSEGFDSTVTTPSAFVSRPPGVTDPDSDEDGYQETSVSANIGHSFGNELNVDLAYLRSEGESEFDAGSQDETDFLNDSASLRISAPISENLTAALALGYARDERQNVGTNPSEFNTERDSISLQFDYQLAEGHVINFGYDFYDDKVESTANFIQGSRDNQAVFAQYLADLGVVSIQANLRNDDNETYGSETTGSAALGFAVFKDVNLSVSYGTAFKAPTFNDLYFPFTDFGFGFTFEGNPNLDPESSESLEVMLDGQAAESLSWSIAYYQTDIEDLIQGSADFSTVENIAEAEIQGVEGTLDWTINGITTGLFVSYVDAEDANSGERLGRRSRIKAELDVAASLGELDVAATWSYHGNRLDGTTELGGYGLLNLRAAYNLSDDITLGARVSNVFDRDYTLLSRFGTTFRNDGRNYSAYVRYSF